MGSLKYLALVALLLSLSLAAFADTSNDATHAKDELKPSEATETIDPQQRGRGGCRLGCAGMGCCSQSKAADTDVGVVVPQQRGRGGCRLGCAGMGCCNQPKAADTDVGVVDPQIRWRGGGCKYGCCGGKRFGRCLYCCRRPQATEAVEGDVVEPQQRVCRFGCCGSYQHGHCNYCCSRKMATGEEEKKEEAKP